MKYHHPRKWNHKSMKRSHGLENSRSRRGSVHRQRRWASQVQMDRQDLDTPSDPGILAPCMIRSSAAHRNEADDQRGCGCNRRYRRTCRLDGCFSVPESSSLVDVPYAYSTVTDRKCQSSREEPDRDMPKAYLQLQHHQMGRINILGSYRVVLERSHGSTSQ